MACLGTAAVSGCATAVRGSTEDVQFLSTPPGAQVKTTLGHECVTPCTLEIGRRDTFTAEFTLGDKTERIFVNTVVADGAAAVAGNVLIGGVIGVGIDVASGAGLDHTPNPVIAKFDISSEEAAALAAAAQNRTAVQAPAPANAEQSAPAPAAAQTMLTAPSQKSSLLQTGDDRANNTTDEELAVTPGSTDFSITNANNETEVLDTYGHRAGLGDNPSPAERVCRPYCQ